jgi:hypothetical protein
MTSEDAHNMQRRIEILKRRKGYLGVQLARQGPNSDPSISMEIEDIEKDIQELQVQLNILTADAPELHYLNITGVLMGIVERMEHLNEALDSLLSLHDKRIADALDAESRKLKGKHYKFDLKRTEDEVVSSIAKAPDQNPSYFNFLGLISGRIEIVNSFYRKNQLLIPLSVDTHVASYRTIVLSWVKLAFTPYVFHEQIYKPKKMPELVRLLQATKEEARKALTHPT